MLPLTLLRPKCDLLRLWSPIVGKYISERHLSCVPRTLSDDTTRNRDSVSIHHHFFAPKSEEKHWPPIYKMHHISTPEIRTNIFRVIFLGPTCSLETIRCFTEECYVVLLNGMQFELSS